MMNDSGSRKLAVVTGASSGIGYELAKVFAKNKYDLIVAAEDASIAEAGDAFRQFGVQVESLRTDLATEEGVDALYAKIKNMGRPVDAIALNAGVGVGGKFLETDIRKEMNLIKLNIMSLVALTKKVLPEMVNRHEGKILFTSSVAGEMPGPYYAVYAASKAFVQSFAEAIRYELKDSGVTVTSLQPGATDTNFFARADMLDTKAGRGQKDNPADVALEGFNAMMAGKDHVVAGSFMNAVQATVAKILPETTSASLQGEQVKPRPAEKHSRH